MARFKKPVRCDQHSLGPARLSIHTLQPTTEPHGWTKPDTILRLSEGFPREHKPRTHWARTTVSEKPPQPLLFLRETYEEAVRIPQNDFHLPLTHKLCISLWRGSLFHIFIPHKSRCVLQSMVRHHSLIRIFFSIFRHPENHNASCNWWHLRVHEIWDINTEIQDINTEMDMQGEARD